MRYLIVILLALSVGCTSPHWFPLPSLPNEHLSLGSKTVAYVALPIQAALWLPAQLLVLYEWAAFYGDCWIFNECHLRDKVEGI